ncbi:hypothetical protein VA7868_03437 [Vibrio aerogenes CECT 7868]|uniref:TM2 domain protein n=1 Tax=Vibrio aerogenes CECT 7868 TaxID=1216006 RepID=A0A1M6A122_9VIBR|nr:hypothetical protein [Vibrio aerogenes]SHI30231.1 hypothetical protein VA7868_03437 [Vibrio aerogenes CECT 7868]
MNLFEPLHELEAKEEQLRQQVNASAEEIRKAFFREQADQIKDPDTYAVLNYMFIGGFHHLYLGRYKLFAMDISLTIIAMLMFFVFDHDRTGAGIVIFLCCFELPQLFLSQKIARQRNYEISSAIFQRLHQNRGETSTPQTV